MAAPMWIWAAVPLTPVVVMLPVIAWSAETLIVPLPAAEAFMGELPGFR